MSYFIVSLRALILVGSFGAGIGALLMFWTGAVDLLTALRAAYLEPDSTKSITANVMAATDAFLFGVVLIFFASAITFGFALPLSKESRSRLPKWMQTDNIAELKRALVEIVLVYLVVDFATDVIATGEHKLAWESLVIPLSVVLIAGAIRLLGPSKPDSL